MDVLTSDAVWDRLGLIARLLHHVAAQVWIDADDAAPDSPIHDLGLGVYLAHSQASALLPDDYKLPDDYELPFDDLLCGLGARTPLQLLSEAEELTRPLPLHLPDLVHGSQLVVDLCDLIREARGLGY